MKPVYEEKLKAFHGRSKSVPDEGALLTRTLPPMSQHWMTSAGTLSPRTLSPGTFFPGTVSPVTPTYSEPSSPYQEFVPMSPIHSANDMRISMLKRSATIGGHRTRTTRSPSFVGKRPSIVRSTRQRQSLTSLSTTESRTSDISLSGVPMPRHRRRDKYASLDHRSVSRRNRQAKGSKENGQAAMASPATATPILPDTFEEGKGTCMSQIHRWLRARWALTLFNNVSLRIRRALPSEPLQHSDSALLVLKGTSLNNIDALLALN